MTPQQRWYYKNRDKAIATAKAWREANPERSREYAKKWKRENRAMVGLHAKKVQWSPAGTELTPEEYETLLTLQDGVCKICARPPKTQKLSVDHDPATGRVRGLLCVVCLVTLDHIEKYRESPKCWDEYLQRGE